MFDKGPSGTLGKLVKVAQPVLVDDESLEIVRLKEELPLPANTCISGACQWLRLGIVVLFYESVDHPPDLGR